VKEKIDSMIQFILMANNRSTGYENVWFLSFFLVWL